jgi:hypothetical protein
MNLHHKQSLNRFFCVQVWVLKDVHKLLEYKKITAKLTLSSKLVKCYAKMVILRGVLPQLAEKISDTV